MKLLTIFAVLVVLAFGATAPALAGTATGTTTLLGPVTSGSSVDVDVSVVSSTPVVAYEYAIQNECWFSGKASGPPDSYQQDDIVNWLYSAGNVPHATMPVYLNTVPKDSTCKVFLVRNNTLVKGSTTKYAVQ